MTEKDTTIKKFPTTVATTQIRQPTPTEPTCNQVWPIEDRCGKWILEFPVFLIKRQSWSESATWPQCDQWASARWCDIDEFCPPNEVPSFIKGMWLNLAASQTMPAEFIIPCDWMRQRIPRFQQMWQEVPAINSSYMSEMRKVNYENTVRGFDANMKEDSSEVFTCRDKHGNKQVPSHGRPNACEYAVTLTMSSLKEPDYWYWTTNNYRELIDHYEELHGTGAVGAQPVGWSPFLRHTAKKDMCSFMIGYHVTHGSVNILYETHCSCTLNTTKCEPLRAHPLDGICPRKVVMMKVSNSGFVNAGDPPPSQLSATDGNAFSDTCRAQISFYQFTRAMMQPYVRFGDEDRGQDDGAMCDGWYRERQCVLLTEDCYRNVMATPLKACCQWRRCDPREDPACADISEIQRHADTGLMGLIQIYLINPSVSGTQMRQELINAVGYCRWHSNVRTKGYREDVPKYCLVFADVHWENAFVNISLGHNFHASHGEERFFESYIDSDDNVTSAILIHGTISKFCEDEVRTDDKLHEEPRRIIAMWKCRTNESEPWNFCDGNVTPNDVRSLAEKPLCYVGTAREGGDKSNLTAEPPEPLNVLCYFMRYADETGNGKWDEYGWYDPEEDRFAKSKYHSMDCFEMDGMNCDNDDDVIFCCCRTSTDRNRICNAPEADLWEQYRVKRELRDPEGIQTNDKERKNCEIPEQKSSELEAEKVVAGFIENEMCYLEVNAHTSNEDIEHEKEHDVRKLYQRPVSDQHPLVELLCRLEYWTTLNWLDGCSCRAYRTDDVWRKYCCCIAHEGDSMSKVIKNLHERPLLRLYDFTHRSE